MVCRTLSIVALITCALATLPLACTPASDGIDGDAGGEGEGEGEEELPLAYCRSECVTASDCVSDGAPVHIDEDNHACNDGVCEYLGCLSEGECDAVGLTADTFTCYREPGLSFSLCVKECTSVSDCVGGGAAGAEDEDNYACDDGACRYLGCRDHDECVVSLGPGARCVDEPLRPYCSRGCEEPADCVIEGASPSYDEDNFECRGGACVHIGCVDDEECAASGDLSCR